MKRNLLRNAFALGGFVLLGMTHNSSEQSISYTEAGGSTATYRSGQSITTPAGGA